MGESSKNFSFYGPIPQKIVANLVPRAFSTVVADGQFSTLGTVLLATLSRLTRVTGLDKELKISSQVEKSSAGPACGISAQKNEDVGVVLCREDFSAPVMPSTTKISNSARCAHHKRASKEPTSAVGLGGKKTRKKKRTKDAIDDLFDSLL